MPDSEGDVRDGSEPYGYRDMRTTRRNAIAPALVGDYVHQQTAGSTLVRMSGTGLGPDLSAPEETIDAMKAWL
jgi:hypothetical protein